MEAELSGLGSFDRNPIPNLYGVLHSTSARRVIRIPAPLQCLHPRNALQWYLLFRRQSSNNQSCHFECIFSTIREIVFPRISVQFDGRFVYIKVVAAYILSLVSSLLFTDGFGTFCRTLSARPISSLQALATLTESSDSALKRPSL